MQKMQKTFYRILGALADGKFHSGQALGKQFGMTRSAVWKGIQEIERLGIAVNSVVGRGYQLPYPVTLLDADEIYAQINTNSQAALPRVLVLDQVNSTNDYLTQQTASFPGQTLACFAEQQSQGKGRLGRQWESPFGYNIYHSILWRFEKDPSQLVGLSLACAIAVIRALKRYQPDLALGIKWPNDIYWQDKKIGGVLLEMIAESHGHCQVIVGVGINTHLSAQSMEKITQPCAALDAILEQHCDRNKLAALLIDELIACFQHYDQQGLRYFLPQWREYDILFGKKVEIHTPKMRLSGTMQGITEHGELRLFDETDQTCRHFICGEVSARLTENCSAS